MKSEHANMHLEVGNISADIQFKGTSVNDILDQIEENWDEFNDETFELVEDWLEKHLARLLPEDVVDQIMEDLREDLRERVQLQFRDFLHHIPDSIETSGEMPDEDIIENDNLEE